MGFYHKLALSNINKNRKFFYPYIFSAIFTISLFYIVRSLYYSDSLAGRTTLSTFMSMGSYVIMVFATIFLLYGNSFVIKNRKKELSLYNILGMEKRHVMVMMLIETLIVAGGALLAGIVLGFLLSQLMVLLVGNVMHDAITFSITWSLKSIVETVGLYLAIFLISLAGNVANVKLANPIELLKGGKVGEKEPRTKTITTIIGVICLSAGYFIALTITDPIMAISLFFVAVILVMIGTYCLFTAGSIALLKLLKKNKRYYYQTRHFTAVSGLIYRMKQNAIGLANICILCTCVLVTCSSTVAMYAGINDSVAKQVPFDQMIIGYVREGQNNIKELTDQAIQSLDYNDYLALGFYDTVGMYSNNHLMLETNNNESYSNTININALAQNSFNQGFDQKITLESNQVYLYASFDYQEDTIWIEGVEYQVVGLFDDQRIMLNNYYAPRQIAIVFANERIDKIEQLQNLIPGSAIGFNSDDANLEATVDSIKDEFFRDEGARSAVFLNHDEFLQENYEVYGSMLFIGIFLSAMFLMAAIVIIYNKQLSEGYEDQNKFEILQNVGMSQLEVKQAIKSQVLVFFFVPLLVAIIHLGFAFPLIVRVLELFLITDMSTYFLVTAVAVAILGVIYVLVYSYTARVYYRIVKR